jgi:hypothetical protein
MCEIVGQYHIPAESTAPAMVLVNQVALGLVAQHLHKSFHNKKILCNLQNLLHTYYLIKLFHGDIISYHIMNIYEYIYIYIFESYNVGSCFCGRWRVGRRSAKHDRSDRLTLVSSAGGSMRFTLW